MMRTSLPMRGNFFSRAGLSRAAMAAALARKFHHLVDPILGAAGAAVLAAACEAMPAHRARDIVARSVPCA